MINVHSLALTRDLILSKHQLFGISATEKIEVLFFYILTINFLIDYWRKCLSKLKIDFFGKTIYLETKDVMKLKVIKYGTKALNHSEIVVILNCSSLIWHDLGLIGSREKYTSQPAFTCWKLTIETLEQRVKYVQS